MPTPFRPRDPQDPSVRARRLWSAVSIDPFTAAGFLNDCRDWLAVEAIDRGGGAFDIAVVLDGTYTAGPARRDELVAFYSRWLAGVLEREGLGRPVGGHGPAG